MPPEIVEYLRNFGFFGVGVGFYWALSTGRIYLAREVTFIIKNKDETIADLRSQLLRAQSEVENSRSLLNKVVDRTLTREDR